ncbi:NACHT, LRR and PYD domains-containing protein 3-like [Anableps anableps]
MDVILTNLITGNLLPSALLWIISKPSGAQKIPQNYIGQETECREISERSWLKEVRKKILVSYQSELNGVKTDTELHEILKNKKPKDTLVKNYNEIFTNSRKKTVRTVLTIGEAGVGKTFQTKLFMSDWAKGNSNTNIDIIIPLQFSDLNERREGLQTMESLLDTFFSDANRPRDCIYDKCQIAFVLDGLDKCDLPLDFDNNSELKDLKTPASMDVILTNLIKGNLLPNALLWIISQPSAINKIIPVERVLECREALARRQLLVSKLKDKFIREIPAGGNLLPMAKVWITSRPSAAEQLPDDYVDRKTEIREKPDFASRRKLKAQLKEHLTYVSEGIDQQKTSSLFKDIYTDLYIIEGDRGEVNVQHECRQVQDAKFKQEHEETPIRYCDIFKPSPVNTDIKTVITIGMAGIGKTFASMKYVLDWAEGAATENIFYTFPLPFRELNLRKEEEHSLEGLIHQFFPAMKTSEITDYDNYEILIVLDGLDECRLDLKFNESHHWTDVRKQGPVSVLLSNLILGNLLPKAQIWITSRPAASNSIPAEKVDRMTEVRGFNDDQKEEYFRKKFSDKELAEKILRHVKRSRSLYIMCHIPVFCWITSKVLEEIVHRNQDEGLPKTLTDIYTQFVLLQCRQANVKYSEHDKCESSESYSCWNTRNKETILSLGKLAFEAIEKGDLLFNEESLKDCGIDITEAAVFSGLFTQIKREKHGLYQQNLFCFVHLSIQEYLAALYVFHTFNTKNENLFSEPTSRASSLPALEFYMKAVDKALESKTGDWDLFLRFLLGLSVETNQVLLIELLKKTKDYEKTYKETVEYIKKKIREDTSYPEKNLNLFHCLNELNDDSLVQEIKKFLQSETKTFESFTTSQWSALTYVLLTSDEKLDVFDLKKYMKSEKVLLGMLPVVKVSTITLLSWCELSEESCRSLKSEVLSSASSNLTELDLSHNDLLDSGVQLLAEGLKSLYCKLEVLQLSGCQVTEKGCDFLASALKSNKVSKLKQLDLSYNHSGDNGMRVLNTIADDPTQKLEALCFDYNGPHRLKPGMKKYAADLKLDERTASRRLLLSKNNKEAKTTLNVGNKVSQEVNEDRFKRTQVFCEESLKCICYWEVEWKGKVGIAVAYKTVGRKWDSSGGLGCNDRSWSLLCSKTECTALHGEDSIKIRNMPCQRIAIFLDWKGGTLSYFNVSSGGLSLIHTFYANFTEELFAGFWFQEGSITLCHI